MKVSKIQRELYDKEQEKEKLKVEQKSKHKVELLKQISEKEWERINQQREKFEEGRVQRLEFEAKERGVQEYIKQKIQKLKYVLSVLLLMIIIESDSPIIEKFFDLQLT